MLVCMRLGYSSLHKLGNTIQQKTLWHEQDSCQAAYSAHICAAEGICMEQFMLPHVTLGG